MYDSKTPSPTIEQFTRFPLLDDQDWHKVSLFLRYLTPDANQPVPTQEAIHIYSLLIDLLNKYFIGSMHNDAYPVCYLINKIAKIIKFPNFSASPEIAANAFTLLVGFTNNMRFPSPLYPEAAKNLQLAVEIFKGFPGNKPVSTDRYVHCLNQLSTLYYREAEECVKTKFSDITKTDALYKCAIYWGTQLFQAKPTSDALNKLSDSVTAFVRLNIRNKDYERALGALHYVNELVVKFVAPDEFNEVGKHWLLGRHYQFIADIYALQEQWQNHFEALLKARHAYMNTKDYRIFEKINTALLVATIDTAKTCLFFQMDNHAAKERGWIALNNALILMMLLDDEVKLAEIIAEFSNIVNMPKMLEAVHQELETISEKPHYKSIDLKSSTVGRFAARKDVKLKNPEVGRVNPLKVAVEVSHSKPRAVSRDKFFTKTDVRDDRNRSDSRDFKRERSPEVRRDERDHRRPDDGRYRRNDYKE